MEGVAAGLDDEEAEEGRQEGAGAVAREVPPFAGTGCGEVGLPQLKHPAEEDGQQESSYNHAPCTALAMATQIFYPDDAAKTEIHAKVYKLVEVGNLAQRGGRGREKRQIDDDCHDEKRELIGANISPNDLHVVCFLQK